MEKRSALFIFIAAVFFLSSCQKEIDWGVNNGSGSGGSGGSTNGDLLVKALQITPSTNDTNVITFKWDANKRLSSYNSAGKVNGIVTNIDYKITRLIDGTIKNIISKMSATAAIIDSTVYYPVYSGMRLQYVIDTQFSSLLGFIRDSSAFTYNTSGQIITKESYVDLLGSLSPSAKETYQYDANGNVTVVSVFSPDGSGGFDAASTSTATFDAHKSAVVLGEESFIVLGAANSSKNNCTKVVVNAVAGTGYTGTYSSVLFNSFDRPTQANLSVTPQPPGYSMKLQYFYQ